MIIQWPDKLYHTTAYTLDKVDPAMLSKVCVLSAAYVYWLAEAGEPEARWLASEMSARFRQRIIGTVQGAVTDAGEKNGPDREALRRRLEYQAARHREALTSLTRLAPVDVSDWQTRDEAFTEAEFARAVDLLAEGSDDVETNEEAARLIPSRLFRGPLDARAYASRLDEAGRDEWWELNQRIMKKASWTMLALAQYWADGQRTVAEIGRLIALETGQETTSLLVEYFHFVERLGLIELAEE
jgi:aminopeptidase YwaD